MKWFVDPFRMIRDIRTQGLLIFLWGGLLNIPQVIGGLLFIKTIEGLVVLITVLFTLIVAGQIHRRRPFSRGIGICHLPWLIMLPWLILRIVNFDHSWLLNGWLVYVVVVVSISLVFDINDVVRYARGSKTFAWANKEP